EVVTLAGANHGTVWAEACGLLFWSRSCPDLAPGSAMLEQLNTDEAPEGVRWETWVSVCELVIVPRESAFLAGAVNHDLTDECVRDPVGPYALNPCQLSSRKDSPSGSGTPSPCGGWTSRSSAPRSSACWGRTARARPRPCGSSPRCSSRTRGARSSTGSTSSPTPVAPGRGSA